MKIRSDFVTNSSSVSFVLVLKENMDGAIRSWVTYGRPENEKVYDTLTDYVKKGSKTMIDGEVYYYNELEFETSETVFSEDEGFNFNELSDKEIWMYICGEYLLNGKIGELRTFGAILKNHY